jgi:hypothetical protein
LNTVLKGFAQRMKALSIYYPLYDLRNGRKYERFDQVSLGFGVLLFILDNMLIGSEYCDQTSIAHFLKGVVEENYRERLSEEEAKEMAYFFLDALRNGGRPFSYLFQDLEEGREELHKFSLIETADYQVQGKMKYKLSETGLDLLFKTKEIYSELRISISQLYLRQQIEKGVFQEALRTVDELYTQVKGLHDRLENMKLQVIRNVSQVSVSDYIRVTAEVQEQLKREKEVFKSLQVLLKQTQATYRSRELSAKEEHNLNLLLAISSRLEHVINEHNRLFTVMLGLGSLLETALLDSMANTFRSKIDFEREFVDGILQENTSLEGLRQVLHPLFLPTNSRYFNILRALDSQQLSKDEELNEEELADFDEQALQKELERDRAIKQMRDTRYTGYLELILLPLLGQGQYTLAEILAALLPEKYADLINQVDFYSFLVQIHQMGSLPLSFTPADRAKLIDAEGGNLPFLLAKLLEAHPEFSAFASLGISVLREELSLANGNLISNYLFVRKEAEYDV